MKKVVVVGLIISLFCSSLVVPNYAKNVENYSYLKLEANNIDDLGQCVGYTLIGPLDSHPTLIDMEGNIIHTWKNISVLGQMLPGGSVVGPTKPRTGYIMDREFKEVIQEEWNGEVIWNFTGWKYDHTDTIMARAHHDIKRVGNPVYYAPSHTYFHEGKTLVLARYNHTNNSVSKKEIVDDVIYEVDWSGNLTGFEWIATEHFDELGFNKLEKIGISLFPGYHCFMPEKLRNFFYIKHDWLHLNSIAIIGNNSWYDEGDERFHPGNIMITSRHANIIAIINQESGNILWKIGPDYSFKTKEGKKIGQIIGPHDAHMIPKDLPGEGNILIFDNGGVAGYGLLGMPNEKRKYSRVIEINPVTLDIVWEYKHPFGFKKITNGKWHKFFSGTISNSQRLPNGNTLICEGRSKRIFEVNTYGDIVWELLWNSDLYRAYRIPPEWVPGNPCGYEPWENFVMN